MKSIKSLVMVALCAGIAVSTYANTAQPITPQQKVAAANAWCQKQTASCANKTSAHCAKVTHHCNQLAAHEQKAQLKMQPAAQPAKATATQETH